MLLVPNPRLEAHRKRLRVRNDTINKALVVDRRTRVLRDPERPQEQRRIDEDGPVGDVLAGADTSLGIVNAPRPLAPLWAGIRTVCRIRNLGTGGRLGYLRRCSAISGGRICRGWDIRLGPWR